MKFKEKFVVKGRTIENQKELDDIFICPTVINELEATGKVSLDDGDKKVIAKQQKQKADATKEREARKKKGKSL